MLMERMVFRNGKRSGHGAGGVARTRDKRIPRDGFVIHRSTVSKSKCFGYLVASDASPQQGDLRLPGPPLGHGAGSGARTRHRRVPADLMADSLTTLLPTPP
ncbi:hypothetical protein PoB_005406500 [Plakobranchus ocellatus]|uniref:Uncharacterized protein n=1 Tax=Plakobranchus ocellatus TaxID=259542 RepID=A0AAV4C799_9GAST|nr:hypothetical protein PoB_005406500 [Plakobranchus ocellatus]